MRGFQTVLVSPVMGEVKQRQEQTLALRQDMGGEIRKAGRLKQK